MVLIYSKILTYLNTYLLKIKSNSYFFKNISNITDINPIYSTSLKYLKKSIIPQKIYINIHELFTIKKIELELKNLKGIYGFSCKVDGKIYIGSSGDLVKRFKEHIKGRKSNIKLQRAIKKHGLENFYYIIFEFYNVDNKKLLVDFETFIFPFLNLNFYTILKE